MIDEFGIQFEIKLPHVAFHRHIGEFRAPRRCHHDRRSSRRRHVDREQDDYLPSDSDKDFIERLMQPLMEIGKFASWIAPPKVGIDNKPGDFEYVKIT